MRRHLLLKNRKLLAGPYLFWSVSFIIIPLLMIFYYGLTDKEGTFTWSNIAMMASPENLKALGLALLLSLVSTLICLVCGYPLAYIISKYSEKVQSFLILMVTIPMWINMLLRTYAWMNILSDNGLVNNLLKMLLCSPQPEKTVPQREQTSTKAYNGKSSSLSVGMHDAKEAT